MKKSYSKKQVRKLQSGGNGSELAVTALAGMALTQSPDAAAAQRGVGGVADNHAQLGLQALEQKMLEVIQAIDDQEGASPLDGEVLVIDADRPLERSAEGGSLTEVASAGSPAGGGAIGYPGAGTLGSDAAFSSPSWAEMLVAQAGGSSAGASSGAATGAAASAAGAGVGGLAIGAVAVAAAAAVAGAGSSSSSSSSGGGDGIVVDGYLSGATVMRVNGSGNTVTTDASGRFTGLTGDGPIKVTGGIDVSTGQAFTGVLFAPEPTGDADAVVTPLSSLVHFLVESGESLTDAVSKVLEVFGLDEDFDLLGDDPVALARDGDSEAFLVQKLSVQIAVLLQVVATGDDSAFAAAAESLASLVLNATGVINLTSEVFLDAFESELDDNDDFLVSLADVQSAIALVVNDLISIGAATGLAAIAAQQSSALLEADPETFEVDEDLIDEDDADDDSFVLTRLIGPDSNLIVDSDEGTVYLDASALVAYQSLGISSLDFDLNDDGVADAGYELFALLDQEGLEALLAYQEGDDVGTNYSEQFDDLFASLEHYGIDHLVFGSSALGVPFADGFGFTEYLGPPDADFMGMSIWGVDVDGDDSADVTVIDVGSFVDDELMY